MFRRRSLSLVRRREIRRADGKYLEQRQCSLIGRNRRRAAKRNRAWTATPCRSLRRRQTNFFHIVCRGICWQRVVLRQAVHRHRFAARIFAYSPRVPLFYIRASRGITIARAQATRTVFKKKKKKKTGTGVRLRKPKAGVTWMLTLMANKRRTGGGDGRVFTGITQLP